MLAALMLTHRCLILNHTYENVWWTDFVMHALGGAWIAIVVHSFIPRSGFSALITIVLVVGGLWEALEFFISAPFFGVGEVRLTDPIWQLDTIFDLSMDIMGAVLLWAVLSRYNRVHA